ncbi:sulfatase-like hydrolase/transferase, partial [bacterium]|nr:sulfatase-like hydrolase/transferase [bacterium]
MRFLSFCLAFILFGGFTSPPQNDRPNILIIITDDVGVDSWSKAGIGSNVAATPRLDSLADQGITFLNAWATPTCSPTRASMLTGMYGSKTGVLEVGNTLDRTFETLFESIDELTNGEYAVGAFGKWHLGGRSDTAHPNDAGAQLFHGYLGGAPADYSSWSRVVNGLSSTSTNYLTSEITDEAISWIDLQNSPWLVWMAHGAAHTPFHAPPDSLYTRPTPTTDQDRYLAMIESIDHETGRLLDSMTSQELENTLIIFVGDNGTPTSVLQGFPGRRGKGTLYQGGLNVPMFVTGSGVARKGESDTALVHVMDVYATLLEIMGSNLSGGIHNSFSFAGRLQSDNAPSRPYLLSETTNDTGYGYAIRNEQFKVIQLPGGDIEMFDVLADPFELNDLHAGGLTAQEEDVKAELMAEAELQF